jgi:hypothetical protein
VSKLILSFDKLSLYFPYRYEAQMEKDWLYILNDSDAKLLIVATEAIYEKCKHYPGKVRPNKQQINPVFALIIQ